MERDQTEFEAIGCNGTEHTRSLSVVQDSETETESDAAAEPMSNDHGDVSVPESAATLLEAAAFLQHCNSYNPPAVSTGSQVPKSNKMELESATCVHSCLHPASGSCSGSCTVAEIQSNSLFTDTSPYVGDVENTSTSDESDLLVSVAKDDFAKSAMIALQTNAIKQKYTFRNRKRGKRKKVYYIVSLLINSSYLSD